MPWMILTLLLTAPAEPTAATGADGPRLTHLVTAIRCADFRGERDELRTLARRLDRVKTPALGAYREYWRGFAFWRSAMNGANETPVPPDVRTDLEAALDAFEEASRISPEWVEPKIGMLFSWVGLAYVPGADLSRPVVSREDLGATLQEIKAASEGNPRALWFLGSRLLFAPPQQGGDPDRAAETLRRGLRAAREEALDEHDAERPPWVPTWGAAENMMSIAYLYTHGPWPRRDLALAYADAALALAPDWKYVRDILVPQIEALPGHER